jgi:chromosome segregation protein
MADARLKALRLVGFKSFAEKTLVEFGPGISAVVGPNGSGKSNLADALRWTLGEQGRTLRTRRSEDVIFAGSSSRRAIGMADVTLVIDNEDRLLPVDYGEVEIGRRLYRSGESEYLLNRQRIRLRDLVELLDAGNLADNAFLFIGQGMVDQALALRPEERRPLFEEAAGVRRHERRRRQAEAELVEAEANLDRVRDVLAELRPQARRLAAQAEQLEARRTSGVELAEGLLAAARARCVGSTEEASQQLKDLERARAAADSALAALKAAEDEAASLSLAIARRSEAERAERDALDRQRVEVTELRVNTARLDSEIASLARERAQLAREQESIDARLTDTARILAAAVPAVPDDVDAELDALSRELELLEPASPIVDAGRELRARRHELDQQVQRRDSVAASLDGVRSRLGDLEARLSVAEKERDTAIEAALEAQTTLEQIAAQAAASRQDAERLAGIRSAAANRRAETEAGAAALRSRVASLDAALAGPDDRLARAVRARGGALIGEGLEVEARFRAAVSAALGAAATAYLVDDDAVTALAGRRGTLAVASARPRPNPAAAETAIVAARTAGGGRLVEQIRRDPQGQVTRLLERVLWAEDIAAALSVRASLLPGWRIVTIAGDVVSDEGIVVLASGDSALDRQAERDAAAAQLTDLESRLAADESAFRQVEKQSVAAGARAQELARLHAAARDEVRRLDEPERVAQRRAEQLLREVAWERAQVERLESDLESATEHVSRLTADVERLQQAAATDATDGERTALDAARRTDLRGRRDELRRRRDERNAAVRAAEDARRRAEVARGYDETRLRDVERLTAEAAERLHQATVQRDALAATLLQKEALASAAAATLDELLAGGTAERTRLLSVESAAVEARERLRQAETRSREAEMHAMEARLHLEQTREQLLVELATIGADGLRVLRETSGRALDAPDAAPDADDTTAETMEDLLALVVERWSSDPVALSEAPSPGRLSALRRRFNELGAGNPVAAQEYAEVSDRLGTLEAQRTDMEAAIAATRELIASLSGLINEQFRTTFAALEDAFERRFHELFGGGDAELTLTMPEDISATGIEIHARPPGKKRQPLSMLSGGERALTAVSLLLAMLEVRPVPFCVLDEVDAALDEANVGRFAKALRGLSHQTQFIVITHNRGTIEGADALYGVTIGDDAVSRVVSMRLPSESANGRRHELEGDDLAEVALA